MLAGGARQSQPNDTQHISAPIVLAHEQSFRIGHAELRPTTREICFAGRAFIVEPRVMQLLIALHRAGGTVVSKDDLLQSCWEGRIVGEDAIHRVVSRLRSIAEKEAGGQFRVETITKVGYRLLSANGELLGTATDEPFPARQVDFSRTAFSSRRPMTIAAAAVLLLAMAAGAWWWLRPVPAAAHGMTVRIAGFQLLSPDLPATLRENIRGEIIVAFNADGVIGVSTAAAPATGTAPAYSLGGTIHRFGDSIRVITHFTNERSGVVLWSDSADYAADQASRIPHMIAVNAGTVIRCGLYGASTYHKSLPDSVLSNYMQYCQEYWAWGGNKTLVPAQRVVAAVPDFSWGWSAVANGFVQASRGEHDSRRVEAMRAAGRQAEDKALALDRSNSEALAHKAYLIDPHDWTSQEALFKSAIRAKPLDCGCEHYGYGLMLEDVGRLDDAAEQYRAATDMLALWPDSQFALAYALVAAGKTEQARPHFDAGIDLSRQSDIKRSVAVKAGVETRDYAAAMDALRDPQLQIPEETRAALSSGYRALASDDSQAKMKAVRVLLALPGDKQSDTVATMLAALGANREALGVASQRPWLFWRPSMRGALNDPIFPVIVNRLGLMSYWRTSRTRPDVCLTKSAPSFCRMIEVPFSKL